MANKQRMYFIGTHSAGEKLAIVEKVTNATTVDGVTSSYQTVSEAKAVKIRGSFKAADLSDLTDEWTTIPERFHEAIAFKVIARGYKDPRNMDLQAAQIFDQEYELGIKKGKKWARSNYQTTGQIKPVDF